MGQSDVDILMNSLKNVVANTATDTLWVETLSPEFRELGSYFYKLQKDLGELNQYSQSLSIGNLNVNFPPKDNYLCAALKNLHANLNHLTWQANQIAQGDYSQQVSGLGDFSNAFNIMIAQLKDREELLKKIAEEKEQKAEMMETFYELFISLMKDRKEWIYVVNMEKEEVLYYNKELEPADNDNNLSVNLLIMWWKNEKMGNVQTREYRESKTGRQYFISAFDVNWRDQKAKAFMVEDVTRVREEERRLSDLAYRDTFTGVFNRRYLVESLEQLIETGAHFTFCYLDINHLKQVNDTFGHAEGDRYIKQIVDLILNGIRQSDTLARIGGDEFGVILLKCPKAMAENKMNSLYQKALNLSGGREDYEVSFSYGVIEIGAAADSKEEYTVESILQDADKRMYEFKIGIKGGSPEVA